MSTVKQLRQAINVKLDKWEAQATALQEQLELNKTQLIERIELQKYRLELIARRVRDKIYTTSTCAAETKINIRDSFKHLQIQLASGVADTGDVFQNWKQRIRSSITAFEADLDLAIAEDNAALQFELKTLIDGYIREADVLEAEIEAMQAQFSEDKARSKADFEKYKQDVQSKIIAYKSELKEKRKVATDKLGTFESELSAGATKIKDAFSNLFS